MQNIVTGTPRPKVCLSDSDLLSQVSGLQLAAGSLYKNDKWIKKNLVLESYNYKIFFGLVLRLAWALRRRVDLILFRKF